MSDGPPKEHSFLEQITKVIEDHLANEQFGVSELAREMGMSRSNLLRKVKKFKQQSASQFIRQVRLEKAMEMLRDTSLTVSEISFRVGFGSTSYFIKCFREHFGYPPGEAKQRNFAEHDAFGSSESHQLAAIMFTDIEGYTALMQQDEDAALKSRDRHRKAFNEITEKFKGKILQYYGDGTLSAFRSTNDAVRCGIELQRAFRLQPQIPVRIGIHSGDILFKEEEIIGDGVNVASRIESMALAGSLLVSSKVYDEIKNQSDIQTTSLGIFGLKNVAKPVEIYAITNPGMYVPDRAEILTKQGDQTPAPKHVLGSARSKRYLVWMSFALIMVVMGYSIYQSSRLQKAMPELRSIDPAIQEKSIAVLPFINDSGDSSNVYIINGLMEAILNHLQKIEDLRVISRTSVEKYRHTSKIIPEIAQELSVRYFVEGSGQKIGDQILLNIQLIEAPQDQHLWSEQYNRRTSDIFLLQQEVAKKIALEIEAIITPDEADRIDKVPTANLAAYDIFLQGLDFSYQGTREGLEHAIEAYGQAIELDPTFARAYAATAIAYYFLDFSQVDKKFGEQINFHADQALLHDPKLAQSLIAKALFYMHQGDYESALPHLEKALEYNPNSALVINILADFYTRFTPNSSKYLQYALKGIKISPTVQDSTTTSFLNLHIANAFIQSGFVDEAEAYINRSLAFDPENLYAEYVRAFILYARNKDLRQTREQLLAALAKDSSRLDIMQEVAKISYFMRDYSGAYHYYQKFLTIEETLGLNSYPVEDAKIAKVMLEMNKVEEAQKYIQDFRDYLSVDQSIYKDLNSALLSAYEGKTEDALQQIKQFSKQRDYHYWILLFFEIDPIMDVLKGDPSFKSLMQDLESKFWNRRDSLRIVLAENNLL